MSRSYIKEVNALFDSFSLKTEEYIDILTYVELAEHLNIDLSDWAKNKSSKFPSPATTGEVDKLITFKDTKKKLDALPVDTRATLVDFASTSYLPIEDKFSSHRTLLTSADNLKKLGAVYTPLWLADYITSLSSLYWGQLHRTGKKPSSVADLSCGTGVFVTPSRKYYGDDVKIFGTDIDSISIDYASLLSSALNKKAMFSIGDALLEQKENLFSGKDQKYDVIVGNPPYVRSASLDKEYADQLNDLYGELLNGNYDLVVPFIMQTINSLNVGGVASIIVSSKFIHSKYGRKICEILANEVRLINIVDFKDEQVFPGYTTYTSILTFAKLKPVPKFSVTYFPKGIKGKEDIRGAEKFTMQRSHLTTFPWNLATSENQAILDKISSPTNPLITDIFSDVLQGVRTGANDIFILGTDECKQKKIEKSFIRSYANGECIRRGTIDREKYKIVYPYIKTEFGIDLVSEEVLRRSAPHTFEYLKTKKAELDSLTESPGESWFEYKRPQNLQLPYKKKILVKEMMPRAEFAYDCAGDLVITSGYAVIADRMKDDEIKMWTWVFNTPVLEYVFRNAGTQLHSGWFRLMKGHLGTVRLPNFSKGDQSKIIDYIHKFETEPDKLINNINKIVARSYALDAKEIDYIEMSLNESHLKSLKATVKKKNNRKDDNNSDFYQPVKLSQYDKYHTEDYSYRQLVTFQKNKTAPIHRWYSFTQGYSDGLIERLIEKMGVKKGDVVLDPFAGTGTTLLSCRTRGIESHGIEISPFLTWVSNVKLNSLQLKSPSDLLSAADSIKVNELKKDFEKDLIFDDFFAKAFSEKILLQILNLNKKIDSLALDKTSVDILQLALIGILEEISQIRKHGSHYRYMLNENSIGLQKLNTKIIDPESDILPVFRKKVSDIVEDVITVQRSLGKNNLPLALVKNSDIRAVDSLDVKPTHVITSPPYLNRNNYIAQQKTELSLLSFVKSKEEYKDLVKNTFRSHTDSDLNLSLDTVVSPEVNDIVSNISLSENNNAKIPDMVKGYFLDLTNTIQRVSQFVDSGAKVAFVVGNSRWGGVVVPVDHILLKTAEEFGFKPLEVVVTRLKGNSPQQMRKFGKIPVRESIVIFEKE